MSFVTTNFHLYGFIIALGVVFGLLVSFKTAKRYGIEKDDVETIYLLLIPASIIGARLYHVFHYLSYYLKNPGRALFINQGGLGVFGAIIAGLGVCWVWSKVKKFSFLNLLDFLLPSVALIQAIGRVANFFNQEAFGPPANLPWKIYIDPLNRPAVWQSYSYFHPLFLYESLSIFLCFAVLIFLANRYAKNPGFLAGLYFVWYGVTRFFTEYGRFDTWQADGFKIAQVLSLIFVVGGLFLLKQSKKSARSLT